MNALVINQILGLAVAAIQAARVARDAARAANPTQPDGTFPSDAELIKKLIVDAGLGNAEAQAFRDWLKTV